MRFLNSCLRTLKNDFVKLIFRKIIFVEVLPKSTVFGREKCHTRKMKYYNMFQKMT